MGFLERHFRIFGAATPERLLHEHSTLPHCSPNIFQRCALVRHNARSLEAHIGQVSFAPECTTLYCDSAEKELTHFEDFHGISSKVPLRSSAINPFCTGAMVYISLDHQRDCLLRPIVPSIM